MLTAWRIVKERYAESAFDGDAAREFGGRWNSPGTAVIYTAASAALAALEILVHRGFGAGDSGYVLFSCAFEERLVTEVTREQLPDDWKSFPAPAALQKMGDGWVNDGKSAVRRVPSVIVPTEYNYLLNPVHADFKSIAIGKPVPFEFDRRLP